MASRLDTSRVADRVAKAIVLSGKSTARVADESGIPRSTLNRKLRGRTEFNVSDLYLIGDATACDPEDFFRAARDTGAPHADRRAS